MSKNPEAFTEGGPLTLASFPSLLDLGEIESLPGREAALLAQLQPGKLAFPGEPLPVSEGPSSSISGAVSSNTVGTCFHFKPVVAE